MFSRIQMWDDLSWSCDKLMKIDWNNTILYSRTRLVILLPMATAILTHQCQIELADNVEKEWVWLSTCANILSCHYLFRTFVRNAFVCCHIPAYSKHGFDNLMFMSTNTKHKFLNLMKLFIFACRTFVILYSFIICNAVSQGLLWNHFQKRT